MADRVATMSRGLVQQVASPADLYAHPTNLFGQGMSRMRSSTVLRRRLGTCDWRSISSSSWAAMYWCICSPTPQQQRVISSPFAAEDAAQIASPAAGARLLARSNPLSRIARRGCRRIHRRYPAGAPVRPGVWKRIERVVSAGIDVLEPVVVDSSRLRHAETVPDAMRSSWLTVGPACGSPHATCWHECKESECSQQHQRQFQGVESRVRPGPLPAVRDDRRAADPRSR